MAQQNTHKASHTVTKKNLKSTLPLPFFPSSAKILCFQWQQFSKVTNHICSFSNIPKIKPSLYITEEASHVRGGLLVLGFACAVMNDQEACFDNG